MAALTANRDTRQRASQYFLQNEFFIAAGEVLYQGALCCLDANGRVVAGAVATTLTPLGRAQEKYDNSGGLDDAFLVKVTSGIYKWENSAGDAIASARKGLLCYVEDDQTVSARDGVGTQSPAGYVYDVDTDGVWVAMLYPVPSV